jgi:predicted DNA-binding transcriptional regulator AlpA
MAMTLSVPAATRPLSPIPTASTDDRDLFTRLRAAQMLSISKRTLEGLIAGGIFPPPVKIGRASRVMHSDIANYLEQLRRQRGDQIGAS